MSFIQACILGAVQGITEFLPISSSAHLYLVPWLFGWQDPGLSFDVFLHFGTFLALIAYFFRDWWLLLRAGIASVIERRIGGDRERLLFWLIVAGTVPACIVGAVLDERAETVFRSPVLIVVTLSSVGVLLYWVDRSFSSLRQIDDLRYRDAVWIGIAQAVAIVPGISRSGATMAMGRFRGMNRETAARFSFLLSVPVTLAAMVFKFRQFAEHTVEDVSLSYLIGGFASSLVFGVLAIHFLLRYLRSADFRIFACYRLALALVVLLNLPDWRG